MEGFGVHTFVLVNKEGRETLVKFHWKPSCGACGTAGSTAGGTAGVSAGGTAQQAAQLAAQHVPLRRALPPGALPPAAPSQAAGCTCPRSESPTSHSLHSHPHPHTLHPRAPCPAGVKCLLEDEAVTVGGTNHSHATQARARGLRA